MRGQTSPFQAAGCRRSPGLGDVDVTSVAGHRYQYQGVAIEGADWVQPDKWKRVSKSSEGGRCQRNTRGEGKMPLRKSSSLSALRKPPVARITLKRILLYRAEPSVIGQAVKQ